MLGKSKLLQTIQAFNSNLEVANFPLKERSPQTLKKLEAVSARRRIEMKELMVNNLAFFR